MAPLVGVVPASHAARLLLLYSAIAFIPLTIAAGIAFIAIPDMLFSLGVAEQLSSGVTIVLFMILSSAVGIWAMRKLLAGSYPGFEIAVEGLDHEATRPRHSDRLGPPALLH